MNVFLTGATGLVGSQITQTFSQCSFNIKAISRKKQRPVKNIEWILSDISAPDLTLCKQLDGTDVIVHNAACIKAGKTPEELEEIQKINIDFTRSLLNCAAEVGIKKVIFTSGLNIIKKPLPTIIDETTELNPLTPYAKSKYIGEQLIQEYAEKYGMNYAILRLSSPVNLDLNLMPETVVKKWIKQSINKQTVHVFGNGDRTQDFVSVTDIANAFLSCIEKMDVNGIFNIASGNTISMLALAQIITVKYNNNFECIGTDENENDRWNISIEKAKRDLLYQPEFTSKDIIMELLNNITL